MHVKGIPPEVIGGVVAGAVVLLLLTVIYRYLLRICRPNEILIFSGRKHTHRRMAARSVTASCSAAAACGSRSSRPSTAWTCR